MIPACGLHRAVSLEGFTVPKSYRPPLRDYATLGALLAKQGQGLEAAAALFVAAQDAARVDAGADATALRCVLSDALERLGVWRQLLFPVTTFKIAAPYASAGSLAGRVFDLAPATSAR